MTHSCQMTPPSPCENLLTSPTLAPALSRGFPSKGLSRGQGVGGKLTHRRCSPPPPEFSDPRRIGGTTFLSTRGPQVPGTHFRHPSSALWPHTMMGCFLSRAGGLLKRLDLGRNTTQDMGTRGPHRLQEGRPQPGSQFHSGTLAPHKPGFGFRLYPLLSLWSPRHPRDLGDAWGQ